MTEYLNRYGLVTASPGDDTCDNGVLFTAQKLLLAPQAPGEKELEPIARCFSPYEGLLQRWPGNPALDGPDNFIGACAVSRDFAGWLVQYGRTTRPHYVYNQTAPRVFTFRAWLGRQPGLIGFAKECAGEGSNWFERLCWNVGAVLTIRAKARDSRGVLEASDRLLVATALLSPGRAIAYRWVAAMYWLHVRAAFGGLAGLFAAYFGAEHPLTTLAAQYQP